MEIFKHGEVLGQVVRKLPDGLVIVNYDGTEMVMSEDENELICQTPETISETTQKYELGGKTHNQQMILGKKIEIKMPNGEVRKGQFAVVELDNLIASHNEKTFANSEGYPLDNNGDNINDRNYKDDFNAQAKVKEFAQNLEPDRLITTSRTPSGTPIIALVKDEAFGDDLIARLQTSGQRIYDHEFDKKIVVSGNNRTMSLKLAVEEYPEKYKEYQDFLFEEIGAFGLSAKKDSGQSWLHGTEVLIIGNEKNEWHLFEYPVLVRIDYDIPALNTLELSKYNKDTKKSERPIDKAIKLSKQLASNERCAEIIAMVVGEYETFTDFYVSGDQKKLLQTLIDCDIITSQEVPNYFEGNGFTSNGKDLIENVLAGIVLDKNSLVITDQVARKFRSIIITSLPVLVANSQLKENSLISKLNEAIEIENKLVTSKLDFKNWINQLNIFETSNDRKALILNRLLSTGRNNFKRSFEKYNQSVLDNQNANMFGDSLTPDEIFEGHIANSIPKEELALIDKTISAEAEPKETMKTMQTSERMNLLVGGKYFEQNPDNILAEQKSAVSKWGKPIMIYEGGIENLEKINASVNFVSSNLETAPTLSVGRTPVIHQTETNSETLTNIETAIEKSKTTIAQKKQRKEKEKTSIKVGTGDIETLSLKEVYELPGMNDNISVDDLRVYLWYQSRIGKPVINSEWYDIANGTMADILSDKFVDEWVHSGKLFYFDGELIPKYLYLSGDVYDKYNRLVVSSLSETTPIEMNTIIEKYGEKVYANQLNELQKIFQSKFDSRLRLTKDEASRLQVLPSSKFSLNFYIKSFDDELPFQIKRITARTNSRFGQPDFLHPDAFDRRNVELFEELNLRDAFAYWLVSDKTISVKQGVNAVEIIQVYLQHKPFRAERAVANSKGDYVGEQAVIYQQELAAFERLKAKTKSEGDRLFSEFLMTRLIPTDREKLENMWNMQFNNNVPIDFSLVPVAFRMNKWCNGQLLDVRPEKREAVACTLANGSSLLAYDVGVGKTPSAIFTISAFIDSGFCTRPIIVVPNQTYKQWINEFRNFCGHIRINEMYNLNDSLIEEWQDTNGNTMKVAEGSVTIITYQGLENIGFSEKVSGIIEGELRAILFQDYSNLSDHQAKRQGLRTNAKIESMIGKALRKTKLNIDDLGIDYLCVDEAHAAKKVFTFVQGEAEEKTGSNSDKKARAVAEYKIQSGSPSYIGIKTFTLCTYIQKTFKGNTQLLTATPFTNSPLEVFSMLAMISYNTLEKMGLNVLKTFFDTFIDVSYEIVINAKMNPERKQVIKGFANIIVLQQLVRRFINYKTGEQVGVQRPQKWVLPYRKKLQDGVLIDLDDNEIVDSIIPMSPLQQEYMSLITQYAEGTISKDQMCVSANYDIDDEDEDLATDKEALELDEDDMDQDEKAGVRLLLAMNHARNLVLSPYLFDCNRFGSNPTYKEYVETSYKIKYTMECIRSIKKYHESTNTPMSGVVIYMERGTKYFQLIREYLIKEIGFDDHEVGIITAKEKLPVPPKMKDELKKEYVKNLFNGERMNENTGLIEKIPDSERIKVLIGSATIREGINLQKYSATLFDLFLSWNPTDIQQLEGRIYRQQNAFNDVRIVNPLLIDSIDVFMFQKLDEKTSRINSIWENDGYTNALKLEDFNPGELKFALIKDPVKLAKRIILEETEKYQEDISELNNKISRNEAAIGKSNFVKSQEKDINEFINKYRPSSKNKNFETKVSLVAQLFAKQLDEEGLPFETWQKDPKIEYSKTGLNAPWKPYWWDNFLKDFRFINRFEKSYLIPNQLRLDQLGAVNEDLKKQIESVREQIKKIESPENIDVKVKEIIEKREAMNIRDKSLTETISEFERLNYLLGHVKLPQVTKKISMTCPPVDNKGQVRVDPDGLLLLDECISNQPTTKSLHTTEKTDEDGKVIYEYTPERKALHKKIIDGMTAKAVCIDRDKPIAILMGGAPGSGKSTFLKKNAPYMTSEYIWKIDADEVRAELPEYEGWNSASTHEETQDIVKRLLDEYDQPCKHDVLYDGTMTNAKKYLPLIKRLKKLGYEVYVAFMDIPKEESMKRAMKRYQDNSAGSKYGRYVPMSVIEDFFRTGDEAYDQIKKQVDGYIKVDALTGKIEEKGGKEIPTDRPYSNLFSKDTDMSKAQVETKLSLEDLKASLKGAKLSVKYLTGKEKIDVETWIKGLEVAIKYYQ